MVRWFVGVQEKLPVKIMYGVGNVAILQEVLMEHTVHEQIVIHGQIGLRFKFINQMFDLLVNRLFHHSS